MRDDDLYVIIGLGLTGLSSARFLSQRGYHTIVMDTRQNPPYLQQLLATCPDVKLSLGKLDPLLLAKAKEIIISPGFLLKESTIKEQIQAGACVISDIELFARFSKAPVCAITGSNAKSTVTSLVNAMAQKAGIDAYMGGNIGIAALDLLQDKEPQLYILELSSFQLETTYSLHPKVATILNISPDHMDRYTNLAEYIAAKQRIYKNSQYQIVNRDDINSFPKNINENNKQISFGLSKPKTCEFGLIKKNNEVFLAYEDEILLSVYELVMKGQHNWLNALSALAIGYALKFPIPVMLNVLREYQTLAHRCELVRIHQEVTWINDSKGTNVGATTAAINGIGTTSKGKIILIAGGIGKDADFSLLQQPAQNYVKDAILFGQDANLIKMALDKYTHIHVVNSLQEAVLLAKQLAKPNESVLFSPACASFDMFDNFSHRGDVFKQLVGELL